MVKLQLRLDQQQTTDLITALTVAVSEVADPAAMHRFAQLRTWLTWRAAKIWGPAEAAPAAGEHQWELCRMCDTRHITANERCPVCQSDNHCGIRHKAAKAS